jgi:aminoglycoside phosphotransferase (APT) family kinase protein
MPDEMEAKLQAYLVTRESQWSSPVVHDLRSISVGWESDVYAFDLEHGTMGARQRLPLILRIYPGEVAADKAAREFGGMSLLYRAGYPVPAVHLLEREASPFGQPFVIMDRVDGTPMWRQLRDPDPHRVQALITQFCQLQITLHRLDWRPLVPDPARYDADAYTVVDWELAQLDDWLRTPGLSSYAPVRDWLVARRDRAACPHPSAIHGDLHPENVLLRADGTAAVIDWTQVTVSDARFDLAWTLMVIGCAMGDAWRARFLAEYERLAGAPVEELDYFDVFACLKRLLIIAIVVHQGPGRMGLRGNVLATLRRQEQAMRWVYRRLMAHTGLHVADAERILASFAS